MFGHRPTTGRQSTTAGRHTTFSKKLPYRRPLATTGAHPHSATTVSRRHAAKLCQFTHVQPVCSESRGLFVALTKQAVTHAVIDEIVVIAKQWNTVEPQVAFVGVFDCDPGLKFVHCPVGEVDRAISY